ncbi:MULTISPECIES: AbrB family transcriptional regulator [unclassified Symbiopectobacterium]|uniref:AbrB family transcriptional regulator n=1 Tax=unclassified Symbiopectobacterium TaxID=2794573 RepID=UPI002226A8D1|nr:MULTISPECIES: AbrB family transcriptional regulator [unclassified Symbiopectobacterium]MCW2476737.1 AbrB family transcriptional regulator [Candidatus Symbiopectobacterium sp. NZEC151]MCW2482239.1 AbrB family transcriptional regulator [Candidatus Symbiopectobacterium sp. NZEC135]
MGLVGGFLLCALAGWLLALINIPLGMMFGPIALIILLSRFSLRISTIPNSMVFIQISLGSSIGLMFREMTFGETTGVIGLLCALCICLSLQFALCYRWCIQRLHWSKEEALLGAVPGAMAAVLALADFSKTPPQKIVISHSLRLITLTVLAGIIVGFDNVESMTSPPTQLTVHGVWLASIVLTGFILGKVLEHWHIPAPYMLTTLFCAALLHAFSPELLVLPDIINQLGMVLMGMLIGHYFTAFPLDEFLRHLWASLQLVTISLGVTLLMAWATSELIGYSFDILVLSWAPGSVESMSYAALAMKVDAGFVMTNHIVRMLIIHTLPSLLLSVKHPRRGKKT